MYFLLKMGIFHCYVSLPKGREYLTTLHFTLVHVAIINLSRRYKKNTIHSAHLGSKKIWSSILQDSLWECRPLVKSFWDGIDRNSNSVILLMTEILHHLGCIKPYKQWDKLPINWCRISAINSTILRYFKNNHFWRQTSGFVPSILWPRWEPTTFMFTITHMFRGLKTLIFHGHLGSKGTG